MGCGLSLVVGCTASRVVTVTPRSSVEQQLLIRSLERSLAQLDVENFARSKVFIDVHGITGDRGFAEAVIKARFRERGLELVGDEKSADLRLKVFLNALGVDRSESLIGLPSGALPMISLPTPEIAFFKSVYNRGYAEVEIYAFDEKANRFVEKTARSVGNSKYDDFTVLLFVSFTLEDLDEAPVKRSRAGS